MRKNLLLITILMYGSFLFSQDPENLFNQANDRMKIGELEQADSLLKESLKIDPSFAPARIAFSEIWLRKGNLSKANEYATLAVRIDEDFRPWWEKLNEIRAGIQNGQKYAGQSNIDKAFSEYKAISEKYPYFSQAHYFMGIAKYKQKDFEKAALFFENALKIYPDYDKAIKALNNVKKRLPK